MSACRVRIVRIVSTVRIVGIAVMTSYTETLFKQDEVNIIYYRPVTVLFGSNSSILFC